MLGQSEQAVAAGLHDRGELAVDVQGRSGGGGASAARSDGGLGGRWMSSRWACSGSFGGADDGLGLSVAGQRPGG